MAFSYLCDPNTRRVLGVSGENKTGRSFSPLLFNAVPEVPARTVIKIKEEV